METTEPRALSAALASPAFVTKTSGLAQHVANRHVERWAPEAGASQVRPLRNLGFVDRLVAPWIEAAQRSASLRMFSQYVSTGTPERQTNNVSWVFPRPWYQDELDWMAAARQAGTQAMVAPESAALPSMLTTRGTYVAPTRPAAAMLPAALYEFVAPSLSVARPDQAALAGEAYSSLVPHAATQAATVMARVMAPLAPTRALSPGLRAVLTTMLERSARTAAASEAAPTRLSMHAPELVTPPAPRRDAPAVADEGALAVADSYAEQRARIADLQRAARMVTERELVAHQAVRAAAMPVPTSAEPSRAAAISTRADASASTDAAVAAERARLEERIAQRLAERTAPADAAAEQQRLAAERADVQRAELQRAHDARRTEIVQRQSEAQRLHETAREAAARDARTAARASDAPRFATEAPAARGVPAEITAALAALPPELASMVAGGIAARPERAAQAIGELGDALRTIELMARTTASGGSFQSARGPRLMMPAGLGGLVATIQGTTAEPGVARGLSPAAARAALAAQQTEDAARMQAPVAHAQAADTRGSMRMPSLPFLTGPRAVAAQAGMSAHGALGAAASADPAALHHVAWADRWLARFAGAKSQSLDVLSAASGATVEARFAALAAAAPGVVFVAPTFDDRPRTVREDADAPATFSPGAAAQGALAARAVAPIAATAASEPPPVVRIADDAETPDDLLAMISHSATRTRSADRPSPASAQAPAAAAEAMRLFERDTLADLVAHAVPGAPGAGLSAGLASSPFAPALRHVLPLAAAPAFDIRALFGGGLSATYLAGLLAPATREIELASTASPSWATWEPSAFAGAATREVPEFSPTYVAGDEPRAAEGAPEGLASADLAAPLTTLRSALLSWTVDAIDAGGNLETRLGASMVRTETSRMPAAYSLLEAMTLPTLGESAALRELGAIDLAGSTAHSSSYAAPGAIADRAHAWSVAQERSSADLSFDFVPPELVLAARVYGLGPAEAAQAARLAIAGGGQLSAMAGAVDRTFVQALAIEHERRTGQAITAYPTTAASDGSTAVSRPRTAASASEAAPLATTAFGVDRRTPRGAFLWPSASIAALGLTASTPDGEQSMSVAALELLAAQAVAELGTFAALSPERARATEGAGETMVRGESARPAAAAAPEDTDEQTVVATATGLVGSARRAKFEAMYVALGQSSATRNWSPAARAARALALAGRGEETMSARERAEIAWDVLPVVAVGGLGPDGEAAAGSLSTGQVAQRTAQQRLMSAELGHFVEQRPGLSTLSSRAGEALGSFVAPTLGQPAAASGSSSASSSSSSSSGPSSRESGAMLRAPTSAPELVRTGQRHGGGDTELPAWFEKAAKKMFEMPTGLSDNITLSELTLVQSAPSAHIAASTRAAPSAMPAAAPASQAAPAAGQLDIEKIANDVYRQILTIMDATRARNGEPYL